MAAFVKITDPLRVRADSAWHGANWRDNRNVFYGIDTITYTDGGLSDSIWYRSQGPIGMAENLLEPRAFTTRGGCEWTITGARALWLRLNVAYSWYTGSQVFINGVPPSTLGLITGVDVVSCDSVTYGLYQDSYVDVLVADGLDPMLSYDISILIDNLDTAKFFSIAGYKTSLLDESENISTDPAYIIAAVENLDQNHVVITIDNLQDKPILDIVLDLDPLDAISLMDGDGSGYDPLTTSVIAVGGTASKTWAPQFAGEEASNTDPGYAFHATLTAYYPDPAGATTLPTPYVVGALSAAITYAPSPWLTDTATPGNVPRRYAFERLLSSTPWSLSFTFNGDALDVTVQRSSGWGVIGIYDGPTVGASLLNSVDCGVDEGGALHTYNLTGFGAGDHTVYLFKTVDDDLPVVFISAAWTADETYSQETSEFDVYIPSQQPVAMWPELVTIGDYDATFQSPTADQHDYSSAVVRTNADVTKTEILTRFPTFAVCYQPGFIDILQGYDYLVLDPLATTPSDVQFLQSLGIKVFGYVSSGEEVGFYADRYNFSSPLAPRPGSGPGGYSTNYMFTKFDETGIPDKNGVWASYYINPFPDSGWRERVRDYYLPQCFGGPEVVVNETVTTLSHTMNGDDYIVFDTAKSPLDDTQSITLQTIDGVTTYVRYQDYTYDRKTGAFVLSLTISPAVTPGQQLRISYTRLGHEYDGLFWDTVDTPDVYESDAFGYEYVPGYKEAYIEYINEVSDMYPERAICFNRGFTILDEIVAHRSRMAGRTVVMFETWLTLPTDPFDLPNTSYYRVTDPVFIAAVEGILNQLRRLRRKYTMDVISLNYATAEQPELKEYCRGVDANHGFLSWQTTILLNNPEHNTTIFTPTPPIVTNAFTVYKEKRADISVWDGGASIWDGGLTVWD